jgi:hypothetical protein
LLPDDIAWGDFLKKDTPDSISAKMEQDISYSYDLGSAYVVRYKIEPYGDAEELNKWLQYNCVEFTWNGEKFSSKKVFINE